VLNKLVSKNEAVTNQVSEIISQVENYRSQKRVIVQCHGVFDLLHPGHILHLEEAKKLGLTYFGFGRWGRNGVVTHHTVHDSLVEITKDKPKDINMPIAGTSSGTPKVPVKENLDMEFEGFLTEAIKVGKHQEPKFLTNVDGKVRVFMVRRSAATEAHQNGGEVVKADKGYIIKLKENIDVQINLKPIQETRTDSSGDTSSSGSLTTESRDCECTTSAKDTTTTEETCGCNTSTEKTTRSTGKTIAEAKAKWSKTKSTSKEKVSEALGDEPGMSLSGASKEKLGKDGKVTMTELTGDETTLSISAQKEDELKKAGISLSTFKAKKFV
jgi:hypothetical protein